MSKVLPNVLIFLMTASGIVYAYEGDYRKMLYFLFAAALNASIVW